MDAKVTRHFRSGVRLAPPDTMRRNLYVKPVDAERWEAISAIASANFSTRDKALDWARQLAEREWEMSGIPWGVKVWGERGGWVYDSRYGEAGDDGVA
jgi:hypothetical protein